MNTVPTTQPDAESCALDWCTNRRGHTDNHVRVVGVVEPTGWSEYQAVIVTCEAGRAETDPLPVLALVGKDPRHTVRMEWPEAARVADLLARAADSTARTPSCRGAETSAVRRFPPTTAPTTGSARSYASARAARSR